MGKIFYFLILLPFLFAGCTSDRSTLSKIQTPSPQELDWANKVIAVDQQQKVLQKREQELDRQEQQIQQSKQRMESENKQSAQKALITENKDLIEKELTESGRTNSQDMLQSFGFNGEVLDYLVDDTSLDGDVFSYSQLFLWKNSDGTGEVARINIGYDIKNEDEPKFLGYSIAGTKHFSVSELAAIVNEDAEQNKEQMASVAPTSIKTPSVWSLNNETVNKIYTATGVAAATYAVPKILDWLSAQIGSGN